MINIFDAVLITIDDLVTSSPRTVADTLPDYRYQQVSSVVGRLEQRGWLKKIHPSNEEDLLQIETRGDRYLSRTLQSLRLAEQPWDGRWYGTLMQIPEERRQGRDSLRLWFSDHGFGRSVDSLWISPYNREEEILEESQRLAVAPYLMYLQFQPLGHGSQERCIQQSWNWPVIQKNLRQTIMFVEEHEPQIAQLTTKQFRRLLAKKLVFTLARSLATQANLPSSLRPRLAEYATFQEIYQRLRAVCYE